MARILVVEDEIDNLEMLEALLQYGGHDVLKAHHGREALAVLETETPDLIITDMMMPYMSGAELLAEIAKSSELEAIPVLVMSAGDGQEIAKRFGRPYMKKPFDIDTLFRKVRDLLER